MKNFNKPFNLIQLILHVTLHVSCVIYNALGIIISRRRRRRPPHSTLDAYFSCHCWVIVLIQCSIYFYYTYLMPFFILRIVRYKYKMKKKRERNKSEVDASSNFNKKKKSLLNWINFHWGTCHQIRSNFVFYFIIKKKMWLSALVLLFFYVSKFIFVPVFY